MEKKYILINNGSASKKYAVYQDGKEIAFAHYETLGNKCLLMTRFRGVIEKQTLPQADFIRSINHFYGLLVAHKIILGKSAIAGIGVRVVAPGTHFTSHQILNSTYIALLKSVADRAPLHIRPMLAETEMLMSVFPNILLVALSDSAFHATMPDVARTYGIPKDMREAFDIHRFGYHGISVASIVRKIQKMFGTVPAKMIVCHLGGGASITAVKDGKSIDTSMGFTPLEGLTMATRVGDIDPGAVLYLQQKLGYSPEKIEEFLNTKCGLLGVSGTSNDIRELIEKENLSTSTEAVDAKLALDLFAYKVKKSIGSYIAVLGGVDMVVFSATVGERSWIMRERILDGLEGLGIILQKEKNKAVDSVDALIHASNSRVQIVVICTDELGEMAREITRFC